MAKKRIPDITDAIKTFKEVMQRASLSSYYHVNGIMLSINKDENKLLVIPQKGLWEKLLEEKEELSINPLDISNPEQNDFIKWYDYGEITKSGEHWIPIDVTEDLFTGKVFKINLNHLEYKIPINRDLMPLKLKKAEYDGISYRVFDKPLLLLAIRKDFPSIPDVPESGFTMIRLFQVI